MKKAYPCHFSPTGIAIARENGETCTCTPMRITDYQRRMLERIGRGEGYHLRGKSERHLRRTLGILIDRGLVDFVPIGAVTSYKLTPAGQAAIRYGIVDPRYATDAPGVHVKRL